MRFVITTFLLWIFATSPSWGQNDSDPIDIRIYPNPVFSEFNIQNGFGITKVVVFNVLGREIKTFNQVSENQIFHVSEIPRGLYWVQLLDKDNKIITTKRISKR
jgi:hypothetical protein